MHENDILRRDLVLFRVWRCREVCGCLRLLIVHAVSWRTVYTGLVQFSEALKGFVLCNDWLECEQF